MGASEWFLTDGAGNPEWSLADLPTPVVAAGAPASVDATATGGTTLTIAWVAGSGGSPDGFDVELESPAGSGTWMAAAGAANPTGGNVLSFLATGLTLFTSYTPRVRAKKTGFPDSAWTVGAVITTDNTVSGGAVIGAVDTTAPILSGSIVVTAVTSTSYTATCPPASDAVGVTGYQYRIGGTGLWTDILAGGRIANISGRTPGTADTLEMRARDAAGNFSVPLSTVVSLAGIAPAVTQQPLSISVPAGNTATFTAAFSGLPSPTLQWYKNGQIISGATSASYSFIPSLTDDGAVFLCQATNGVGTGVATNPATLTVTSLVTAPGIITQPSAQSINEGSSVTFSVIASGTAPLSYQWRKNGVNIVGATAASYTTTPVIGDSGALYSVIVSNGVGSVTSSSALLSVMGLGGPGPFSSTYTILVPDTSGPRDALVLSRSRGDTFMDQFVIRDSNTNALIDISGCSFVMTLDPDPAPTSNVNNVLQLAGTILDATGGKVGFPFNATQSDLVGSFYFDIQVLDTGGRKRTLKYGQYVFPQDITKN